MRYLKIDSGYGKVCPQCKKLKTDVVGNRWYKYKCFCGWEGDYRTMKTERGIKIGDNWHKYKGKE
jgi:hypothetical protein